MSLLRVKPGERAGVFTGQSRSTELGACSSCRLALTFRQERPLWELKGGDPRRVNLHLVVDGGYEVSVRTGKVVAKTTGAGAFLETKHTEVS